MLTKITDSVVKCTLGDKGNVYFFHDHDAGKKIIIDTGNRTYRDDLKNFLGRAVNFEEIDIVIFTHLHYDHCGNFDLFPNAKFYASEQELLDAQENALGTVLDTGVADMLAKQFIKPIPDELQSLKIIRTPGHTKGSICLWYEKERILFSGDPIFSDKSQGRTDLPTSSPQEMKQSIMNLIEIPYKHLCPGHDY